MKRIYAVLLACIMLLSACAAAPASTDADTGSAAVTTKEETASAGTEPSVEPTTKEVPRKEIIIWAFGSEEELTKSLCARFLYDDPALASQYDITVKPVNAEDLILRIQEATDTSFTEGVIPDVEEMPDLFFFYSDDYEMLHKFGLLSALPEKAAEMLKEKDNEAAIAAASSEDAVYAYPVALENTLLLYYDKSLVSDLTDLASVISQCGESDRCFYTGTETTMFPAMLFLSCGLNYSADIRPDGSVASVSCDYYTEEGLRAAKLMQSLMSMAPFRGVEGSPILAFAYTEEQAAAMIADSFQTQELKAMLAENYGVAAIPDVLYEEENCSMLSRGSFTMIGVSPKKDESKRAACQRLAEFLVSDQSQLDRYAANGTIPVSKAALENQVITEDETASALKAQMPHVVRKVKFSEGYIEAMNRFTRLLIEGGSSMKTARLQQLLDELSAYLMADGAKVQAAP